MFPVPPLLFPNENKLVLFPPDPKDGAVPLPLVV